MELHEFGPDDVDDVRRYAEVTNAERAVDSPWVHPTTPREAAGLLRHGWDGEPPRAFLATEQGAVVGHAELSTSDWDNRHLAWLWIGVHPSERRRGHGSAILEAMIALAREQGRTSIGIDGWDSPGIRAFADIHHLEERSREVNRRQVLSAVDWTEVDRIRARAAGLASDYELLRRVGYTPEDELAALARLTAAINDSPTDDLDVEDEVFVPERVHAYEHAQLERGFLLHRVVARHRETGELAGQTVVAVDGERPTIGDQHDTSVVRGHRGHRLGTVLKVDMMQWLHETQPQVETVDTWNAESNAHMIRVNEQLGFRVLGRALAFQRSV